MAKRQWHLMNNAEQVAHSAVHRILIKAQEAISHRGVFKLVLAGGSTPKRVYELLVDSQQEWDKWQIFIGDERCLPSDDEQRNSLMIEDTWLNKINFPKENYHPIQAELGPEQGAKNYAQLIKSVVPFDMTLLGMGEDGHTASLFPGHLHASDELAHSVYDAPKAPPERVSLSFKALSDSEQVLMLITGESKKPAVQIWQDQIHCEEAGELVEKLPIARVQALISVDVFIDQDAQVACLSE